MPIHKGKPNPLNLFDCRVYEYPAKHLDYVTVERHSYNIDSALHTWINDNLSGRYFIGKAFIPGSVSTVFNIGFENPSEASYFQLACPLLKY